MPENIQIVKLWELWAFAKDGGVSISDDSSKRLIGFSKVVDGEVIIRRSPLSQMLTRLPTTVLVMNLRRTLAKH